MSRTFQIEKNPYSTNKPLFNKDTITIKPRITVLVGGHGVGKTTLLKSIEKTLKKENICYSFFSKTSPMETIKKINKVLFDDKFLQEREEAWLLFDSIDDGLSVGDIVRIKEDLFRRIIFDKRLLDKNIYIVVASHHYEMAYDEHCFDVSKGEYILFTGYDSYRDFIFESEQRYQESIIEFS